MQQELSSTISCEVPQSGRRLEAPLALVIGSGLGGLAAALRLSVRGYRVHVLERRAAPGGRAYVIRDRGFVFDCGPTVITAPFLLEELWKLAGQSLHDHIDLRPVAPFYRVRFHDGETFDYCGSAERMRSQISAISPRDADGYDAFLEQSREIFMTGFEELAHVPFDRIRDMIRIVPDMLRLGSYRSVAGMVGHFVKHEKVRQVLSFHPLLVGGNPYSITSIYTLIAFLERKWGVHFPMGGTGSLVQGLVSLLKARGVEVECNSTVEEILVKDGRACGVRLDDGRRYSADIVVSNADSAWTLRHLLPEKLRPSWPNRKIEKSKFSMGLFVWYFGTNRKYSDVPHHSILLGPRYRGLLDDIFKRKILAEDFSLYLHRPTATDPSMAPPGCDTFYVLSPVPHLDANIDWSEMAEVYRKRIEEYLGSTVLPGLSDSIVCSHTLDPQGFRQELLSYKGAAFSFEPVLGQSAYFRPHNRFGDIAGLYFVGAGTHPGAGVPGVLSSARVLDQVVPDPNVLAKASELSAGGLLQ